MTFGTANSGTYGHCKKDDAFGMLDAFYSKGGNFIDTAIGISDTPAWVVSKANEYARQKGPRQFVVYQGMWNATMRDFERDIIPMCREEGMGLCPYGVLNQGRFQTEEGFRSVKNTTRGGI
ncbi:hypothetical protein AN1617.2 [Aspergillus nidulans FGSC A4]|uniref:NADP-dependent oxidoreductase domain-containing protein n=1 Tax=Emericella nidulans (strain FGSC A4 / ATCC 38163 / CBS 112.46 / NRRL 194 / M139) TaxID=227321 RepID=Q5BCW3_EMENI|nr:hypothetical protein [Aspergillus nidulans FGSC A4]EAA64737.1 hypothetical protein AN1617.2 [Aspergillus nidulans FGSC A4]CBF85230.1 TPA: conserved hypothetical protein [Aspergillus nidulans FGSC A4]|eukprot:XP_659221.1 hypothetical protein AN1617.2 [Aspergillus nidulans FGSC A4]